MKDDKETLTIMKKILKKEMNEINNFLKKHAEQFQHIRCVKCGKPTLLGSIDYEYRDWCMSCIIKLREKEKEEK